MLKYFHFFKQLFTLFVRFRNKPPGAALERSRLKLNRMRVKNMQPENRMLKWHVVKE